MTSLHTLPIALTSGFVRIAERRFLTRLKLNHRGRGNMLRKILECDLNSMTDSKFREVLDLASSDIKTNRVDFGKRTSLPEVVEIVESCFRALQRGRSANP